MFKFRKHAPCNSSEIYFVSAFNSQIEDFMVNLVLLLAHTYPHQLYDVYVSIVGLLRFVAWSIVPMQAA